MTREDIQKNKDILFVFGDNDIRQGLGGFAKVCRGEPNALGIRVKKLPSLEENAFYNDDEFEQNKVKIDEDIEQIRKVSKVYSAIYIPDGIGAGLAQLDKRAPDTYKYLMLKITEQLGIRK